MQPIRECESVEEEDSVIYDHLRSNSVIGSVSDGVVLRDPSELRPRNREFLPAFECSSRVTNPIDVAGGCHITPQNITFPSISSSLLSSVSRDFSVLPSSDPLNRSSTPPALTSDQDAARLARNYKDRQRYACMSSERKEALLSKRRSQSRSRRYLEQTPVSVGAASSCLLNRGASVSSPRIENDATLPFDLPVSSSHCSSSSGSVVQQILVPTVARRTVGRFDRLKNVPLCPWELPAQDSCNLCGAHRFYREPPGFCCGRGQIALAPIVLSPILMFLFTDPTSEIAKEFRRKSRSYNHGFAFTSIGMKVVPDSWWAKHGVYSLKVHGKVSHFMNPIDGFANTAGLLQLFFLDTADALESTVLENRDVRRDIMDLLIQALAGNPYTKFFKRLSSWGDLRDAKIVIRTSPALDQRNCNINMPHVECKFPSSMN